MRSYNRITANLQRTAGQLRSLRAKNDRRAKRHNGLIKLFNRIHQAITEFKGRMVIARYDKIVKLDFESRRADNTAIKIESLLV